MPAGSLAIISGRLWTPWGWEVIWRRRFLAAAITVMSATPSSAAMSV